MQKRSHKLLASTLLQGCDGFQSRRFELAFLFGSFQPDCNPLSYLKGAKEGRKFRGHNFRNSNRYINNHIDRLQRRAKWTMWQYYTLGKLTHYLADAFTFPHNDHYPDTLIEHRHYEDRLRECMADYLHSRKEHIILPSAEDAVEALRELHQRYMNTQSDLRRDARYILEATTLLMAAVLPQSVLLSTL